jgi:hypothetical protein
MIFHSKGSPVKFKQQSLLIREALLFNEDKHWFYNVSREDVIKIERLATCNWLLAVYTSLTINHSIKYFLNGIGEKSKYLL